MQSWVNLVASWNCAGLPRKIAIGRDGKAGRIVDDELLLDHTVHQFGLQDLFRLKAVIKHSEAAADDHLRRSALATHAPGKSNAGRPIRAVGDVILSFKSQAIAQGDVGPYAPVVLEIKASVVGRETDIWSPSRNR